MNISINPFSINHPLGLQPAVSISEGRMAMSAVDLGNLFIYFFPNINIYSAYNSY